MSVNDLRLRKVLKTNAIFSASSGVLLLTYRGLATVMNANATTLMVVGGGLLIFAFIIWLIAVKKEIQHKQVWSIIIQDWIWVLASFAVIIFQIWSLSTLGYWLIGATALIVMVFALAQSKYLKRITH